MIWILLAGILVALVYYFWVKPMSHWKDLGVKQTKPWPLIGDSLNVLLRRLNYAEFVEWVYNMHPNTRYTGCYQFTIPTLVLKDPDLIKQIMVKDFDHFTDRRAFIDPDDDPLWGVNLLFLKGQRWREMRATLSGSFTSNKIFFMFGFMKEAAENFVQFFLDKKEDVIEVELKDVYTRYANDVIATTAFGIKCDSLRQPNNEFYLMGIKATSFKGIKMLIKFIGYFVMPKLFRLLQISFFEREVAIFFKNVINETIKTREEKGIERPDMLNLLLKAKKGINNEENEGVQTEFGEIGKFKQIKNLSNDDIAAQALIFFFAGFDTISTVLSFGSYELATNKDVQDKLRDEINEIYKKTNGKLTNERLVKMQYMNMVVSEILRKWTPQPTMDRICTKPYIIEPVYPDEKPVSLNVGDVLWFPIHGIHRDPANFPNPEKFDPERFSFENRSSIKPYTYVPFGTGPRNCIGSRFALIEVKILLFNLLLHFEIVPTAKTQIPLKLDRKSLQHTAEGGFWLGLKQIKK